MLFFELANRRSGIKKKVAKQLLTIYTSPMLFALRGHNDHPYTFSNSGPAPATASRRVVVGGQ